MEETQSSIFEEDFKALRRKDLLPWWIKAFNWFFMLMGFAAILIFFANLAGKDNTLVLYGLSGNGAPFSLSGLLLTGIALLNGATAYGLWQEKVWAVNVGMVSAFVGIVVCVYTMISPANDLGLSRFRIELIPLFFFLRKLLKIRDEWDSRFSSN